MSRLLLFFAVGFLSILPASSQAQGDCTACSITQEYGIQGIREGSTYRNFDGMAVTIVQVDHNSRQALVYAAGYPNARRTWIPAENIYTDQRLYEKQQTVGLVAACAAYREARNNQSMLGAILMRGACCDSSAAKRYGAPRDLC